MSLEKKILTMSANLSSNSKDSSTKAKSIKDEIFEYFNRNLFVINSLKFDCQEPKSSKRN